MSPYEVVELVTRVSISDPARFRSIRSIAASLGVSESTLYRALSRARRYGFEFTLSLNARRMGYEFIVGRAPGGFVLEELEVEGDRVSLSLAPKGHSGSSGDIFRGDILFASRPNCAWLSTHCNSVEASVHRASKDILREILLEHLRLEPPAFLWGRSYRVQNDIARILAYLIRGNALESVASAAGLHGLGVRRAQRALNSLWKRRVILGYGVWRAPFFKGRGVLAIVTHPDPVRIAYSLPIIPSVAYTLLVKSFRGDYIVLVKIDESCSKATLELIKEVGGEIGATRKYKEDD